ncbi:DUF2264 domain-containing protein [Planotetraspora sp. A-T 1434]|uniref:DUF2264 domain-containing protein n=1 Tax=Planotetraspora sp. A-T 1434 TaxID=2979219 RepID=UPI0021BF6520|nr:DUF2264 domain-containing protein [Planotetraspora sp. A-T 1434]MCT9934360.1 DUF2264 domain-containing protein [Planotetraspora sp. A-T 1434]
MREWLAGWVRELVDPLIPHYSPGGARVRLGANVALHDDAAAELETFARPLWGLAPLAAGGGFFGHWDLVRRGLASGTDPGHPEYWGEPGDGDQRIVEMAALGFALALAPERLWDPLTGAERDRLAAWLATALERETTDNNWRFFGVLVSLGLDKVGIFHDKAGVEARLDRLETYSLGDGWYADGPTERRDYYVPWAMHFYGLIYAALSGDGPRSARFTDRAARFAADFQHWFAGTGAAVPYGRSLTYRFAQAAFWGALAFAGVEALPWGVIKGQLLRNLRWWRDRPILDNGLLSVGYAYAQPTLAEQYNAPGSPYWAMKAFLPLALPGTHPFWTAEEAPAPPSAEVSAQPHAGAVLMRTERGRHVVALASRQHHSWVRHGGQKYAKFAYSSHFGFSVPAGGSGLEQGAHDSMLALSDDGTHYRAREVPLDHTLTGGRLYSRWQVAPDVEVETWLIARPPWHVRVHRLRTGRHLHSAEGGFAIDRDLPLDRRARLGMAGARGAAGLSAIHDLGAARAGEMVEALPGTNVMARRTFIPTLVAEHPPGEHLLVTAVLGLVHDPSGGWPEPPAVPDPTGGLP